jgi:hypothetical protein
MFAAAEPNYLTLSQNLVNSFAYVMKQGTNGGAVGHVMAAVCDFVLPTTANILAYEIAGGAA